MTKRIAITLLTLGFVGSPTLAKEVFFGRRPITLKVRSGYPTLLFFPAPVQTISGAKHFRVYPTDKNSPNYKRLSVEPRLRKGKKKVLFVLSDGTIIEANLVISKDGPPFYQFRSPKKSIKRTQASKATTSPMELMKAMIQGKRHPAYKRRSQNSRIKIPGVQVKAKLKEVYKGSRYSGYVITLSNRSRFRTWSVDIPRLGVNADARLILAHIDPHAIGPRSNRKSEATLRLVTEQAVRPDSIILPFEEFERKK